MVQYAPNQQNSSSHAHLHFLNSLEPSALFSRERKNGGESDFSLFIIAFLGGGRKETRADGLESRSGQLIKGKEEEEEEEEVPRATVENGGSGGKELRFFFL